MIKIAVLVFNPFQENTYVVSDDTGECVIIDAGNYYAAEDEKLAKYIEEKRLTPVMAVNTHGHLDHMVGAKYVKDTYNVPFALHSDDIETFREHSRVYGQNIEDMPTVDIDLKHNKRLEFGKTVVDVLDTPGHSRGHVCLYFPESKALFTGDVLFRESIGRTDLPGGDYSSIMKSILEKLVPLDGDVKVYPGHGPASSMGHEVLYNPFITEVLNNEVSY